MATFKAVIFHITLVIGSLNLANSIFNGCDKEAWKWCEQSRCTDGCECRDKPICKQVCTTEKCSYLQCVSKRVCTQSVIPQTDQNSLPKYVPYIQHMKAVSTNIEQDCSLGVCGLVAAIKTLGLPSKALQVCVNGICKQIISNVDYTRQLAENVDEMRCDGPTSCDQVCVIGKCKMMYCNSQKCKQRCSVGSTCTMICGKDSVECQQTCEMGSSCRMSCLGANCSRNCSISAECEILNQTNIIFEKGSTTLKPFVGNNITNYLTTRETKPEPTVENFPPYNSSPVPTTTTGPQTQTITTDSKIFKVNSTEEVREITNTARPINSTSFDHVTRNTRTSGPAIRTKTASTTGKYIEHRTKEKIQKGSISTQKWVKTISKNKKTSLLSSSEPRQTTDMSKNYIEEQTSTSKDTRTLQKPDKNNEILKTTNKARLTKSPPTKSSSRLNVGSFDVLMTFVFFNFIAFKYF